MEKERIRMAAEKKKPPLDIFKVMSAIDNRKFGFYKTMSDEEKKAFSPLVIMRWISAVRGSREINEYYLQIVNELVNKNLWDPCLSKHPELLYLLLAHSGIGSKVDHEWIKGFSREKKSKLVEFLKQFYPTASTKELEFFITINSKEQLISLVNDSGMQDDEAKSLIKEIKETKK